MIKKIVDLLNNYNGMIIALCSVFTLIGTIIGVFINKASNKKSRVKQENDKLKERNKELEEELFNYKSIEKIENNFKQNPLEGDCLYLEDKKQYICPVCWYKDKKIVPVFDTENTGYYKCNICANQGIFDKNLVLRIRNNYNNIFNEFYED